MPYGDRRAMVLDPWGNIWEIATHGGAFAWYEFVSRTMAALPIEDQNRMSGLQPWCIAFQSC
jgi:hypothetical protein